MRASPGVGGTRRERGPRADDPHALPERGRDRRRVRRRGAGGPARPRCFRRSGRGGQRLDRRVARARRRARRARGGRRRARLRRRAPRRHRGGARPLRRDGRRGPLIRLRRDRPLPRAPTRGRRPRHGEPLRRRDRARRDARSSSLSRESGPVGARPALLQQPGRRFPLRDARLPARRDPRASPADDGHGVRVGDDRPREPREAADRRGADDAPAGSPRPAAPPPHLARRVAAPALPAPVQPALAVPLPRRGPRARRPCRERRAVADPEGPHAHLRRDARRRRVPDDAVRGVHEDLRDQRGPAARGRPPESDLPRRHARGRAHRWRAHAPRRRRGVALRARRVGPDRVRRARRVGADDAHRHRLLERDRARRAGDGRSSSSTTRQRTGRRRRSRRGIPTRGSSATTSAVGSPPARIRASSRRPRRSS